MWSSNLPVYTFSHPNILLDSKRSCQLLLKYHPKSLHTLKCHIPPILTKHPEILSFIKVHLGKISKRLKCLHSLNVTECSLALVMTKASMLTFMKNFHRLRNLTMNCYYIDFKFLHSTILWLQTAVCLKSFKSILIADLDYFFIDRDPKIELLLHKRFIKSLSATKSLETLELSCPQDILVPSLFKRLVNIKNLTLHGSAISPKNSLGHKKTFPFVKSLKSLEIVDVPKISSIINILTSVWDPERVICLGFKLCTRNPIDYNSFSQLNWALKPFRLLKKFSLVIENSPINFNRLEVLQGLPLEDLNLNLSIKEGGYLTSLGALIGGFKGLKVLKLTFTTLDKSNNEVPNDLVDFLRNLKNLTGLQVLCLHIQRKTIEEEMNKTRPSKAILALSDSLLALQFLTELDFECKEMSYRGNLKLLVKGLMERAPLIRRFTLGLNGEELMMEDFMGIFHLIREMKGLEELGLRGLKILEVKFLQRLCQMIEAMRLKLLDLSGGIIGIKKGFFLEILERILGKKGIERFVGNGMVFVVKGKIEKVIDLVEIVKRNINLKRVEMGKSLKKHFRNQESFIRGNWK